MFMIDVRWAGFRRDNIMNEGSGSSSMPNIAASYPDTPHEMLQVTTSSQTANCHTLIISQ